jgi:hypothetical protein
MAWQHKLLSNPGALPVIVASKFFVEFVITLLSILHDSWIIAQPNDHSAGLRVDLPHLRDLVVPLWPVPLVNAQSVYPNWIHKFYMPTCGN